MKDLLEVILGTIFAFILYVVLSKLFLPLVQVVNVLSLLVIYFAYRKGDIFGACLGAGCGLIQDSFSLGVFGVGGLAKTVMGFLAGYIAKKIDISPFLRNFVLISILIAVELSLWVVLYSYIFSEKVSTGNGLLFFQPFGTALLGSSLFHIIRKFKKVSS